MTRIVGGQVGGMTGKPEVGYIVGFVVGLCVGKVEVGDTEGDVGTVVGDADGDFVDGVTVGFSVEGVELVEEAVGKTLGIAEGADGRYVEEVVEVKVEVLLGILVEGEHEGGLREGCDVSG